MIGDRNLDNNQIEYKARRSDDKSLVNVDDVVAFIKEQLAQLLGPFIFKGLD